MLPLAGVQDNYRHPTMSCREETRVVIADRLVGRQIYMMDGNEKAARLSGVNTPRLLFHTFVNMGALAALAVFFDV